MARKNNSLENQAGAEKQRGRSSQSSGVLVAKRLLHNKSAIIGISIILIMVLISVFAPYLSPYSYKGMDLSMAKALPSWSHPMGCDDMGRDILTRLMYGGRYSISIGLLSALFSTIVGVVIGAVAGFFGGKVDLIIMRFIDIVQSLPSILMSILVATVLGAGFEMTILALGISSIPGVVRTMRASILTVRKMDYVEASVSINCSNFRIIRKYVIPNAMAPVLCGISNNVSHGVIAAASLSYIGLGVQPPSPEWGAMLSGAKAYILSYPHMVFFPGVVIMIFVLAFNLFSDALRDALDPKLKT